MLRNITLLVALVIVASLVINAIILVADCTTCGDLIGSNCDPNMETHFTKEHLCDSCQNMYNYDGVKECCMDCNDFYQCCVVAEHGRND